MKKDIHKFQKSILRELLFKPKSRFSELKKVDIENYHFTFHLKSLVKQGLVLKEKNTYSLTVKGKEFANLLDTDSLKIEKQAKVAVALHAVRKVNGKTEYLIHKRLKEPFYGWYGSHTGKIKWGESPLSAAKREFTEETGLVGTFKLVGIVHHIDLSRDKSVLEDKYFWVYKITNTKGKLKVNIEEGKNIWMREEDYKKTKNTFASFKHMQKVLNFSKLNYIERQKVRNYY